MSVAAKDQHKLIEFLKPNPNHSGSLYVQLTRALTLAIAEGLLKEGDFLMPQRDLAAALGVSRVTLRKAIDNLEQQGLLEQRQGAGTIIKANKTPPIQKNLAVLNSFTDDMHARGMKPSSLWVNREHVAPSPKEALALNLSFGEKIFRLTRVRNANDVPIAFELAATPAGLMESLDSIDESLYQALERYQARPVRALQSIAAQNCDSQVASFLQISPGDAVLYIERKAFDHNNRPVEFTRCYFRGDLYDLVTELKLEV
ncbi:GntR family transcriptional regulator [Gynuella sunshinyii]|uniref:Transcriptional regulator n=1 Tax=Gynuella sunshinyii YC6258 TaxID=1445510 RepID=A0A0C5VED2_9GAMM|nr:GntR family transcriptional regulator [Gynuella sunshinyii]AJQ92571.1 transcriptional regulator [Gynuella sunshinyii YC6258]